MAIQNGTSRKQNIRAENPIDFLFARETLGDRVRGEANAGEKVTKGEGTTAGGNDFCSFATLATDERRTIHVVRALVLNAAKKTLIEVDFEGYHRATTDAGRAAERREFERAADLICRSAE